MTTSIAVKRKSTAKRALELLPKDIRLGYVAHFQQIPETYKFAGLVCVHCDCWLEAGHERGCATGKALASLALPKSSWKAIVEAVRELTYGTGGI